MAEPDPHNVTEQELVEIPFDTLLGMINTHWNDLHHSRNQDWQYWVILAVIGGGLATLNVRDESQRLVFECLLTAGAMISTIAAMVAWNHTELHVKKTSHISLLEFLLARKLKLSHESHLRYQNFKQEFPDRWYVGGIIFATYAVLAANCVCGLVLLERFNAKQAIGIFGLTANVLFFVCAYYPFTWIMKGKRTKYHAHLKITAEPSS